MHVIEVRIYLKQIHCFALKYKKRDFTFSLNGKPNGSGDKDFSSYSTSSLSTITDLVKWTKSASSTAKAGKLITLKTDAAISLKI
jgi:hypothetical protein